tara:strand:+ start:247 stop:462 length:216 start_codon:yes stop_codon:yes gene_type:complete
MDRQEFDSHPVALFLSREDTLSIIQSLGDSIERCEGDGRLIMANRYKKIYDIMDIQYKVAQNAHRQDNRRK